MRIGDMEGIIKQDRRGTNLLHNRFSGRAYGETKREVMAYVDSHPGVSVHAIGEAIGYKVPVTISKSIQRWAGHGELVVRKLDGKMRVYPKGYFVPETNHFGSPKVEIPRGVSGLSREIVSYMEIHPSGVTISEVASYLKRSYNNTYWLFSILRTRGLVGAVAEENRIPTRWRLTKETPKISRYASYGRGELKEKVKELLRDGSVKTFAELKNEARVKDGSMRVTINSLMDEGVVSVDRSASPSRVSMATQKERRRIEQNSNKLRPSRMRKLAMEFIYERIDNKEFDKDMMGLIKDFTEYLSRNGSEE